VLDRAVQLRKEITKRHTSTLLDIMKREGTLDGKQVPHRATLDRHLARRGASRRHLKTFGEKRTIAMRFERFGQLWVGDYKHGPVVLGPDGKLTTAKLAAFIDHCTRYPVSNRWYLGEDIATLRDSLLRAFLSFGVPEVVYVDWGAVYRAEQLGWSLACVNVKLVHSRPYYSQGRGVIERWWQHADAFLAEVRARQEPLTLHELNLAWQPWCELRYCQQVHSELGTTPAEAIAPVERKPLDPDVARELFLVKAERTVDKRDACVSVEGRRFLCESFLRRQRVDVRYDPGDLSSVLIFHDGKRVQRAFPQVPNVTPEPHPVAEHVAQSVDYLALLREDFDKKLLEHARPLAYSQLVADERFDAARFVEVVAQLAGLKATAAVRAELESFWATHGPLPEEIVRVATEHAVRLHARGRHVRIYLHAIRTLVLAHLRGRPNLDRSPS
ncbi:MAG: Mu transposase C-terminal domain-containing protein, partial [Chloroflexota bacterium]|nr:Mu transposase C-terminal domain-containing protein [Chloroflexota bacterium]